MKINKSDPTELLIAFKTVDNKYPGAKLLVVGDGPLLEQMKCKATELSLKKNVKFIGSRNNINEILDLIDIYVPPSFNEGISNTLLEAMSSATPVIVSNVGGNKEIVVHKKVGYLYSSGNTNELSERIIELIGNVELRHEFGNNARQHVIDNYSLEAMLDSYAIVFQQTMSN